MMQFYNKNFAHFSWGYFTLSKSYAGAMIFTNYICANVRGNELIFSIYIHSLGNNGINGLWQRIGICVRSGKINCNWESLSTTPFFVNLRSFILIFDRHIFLINKSIRFRWKLLITAGDWWCSLVEIDFNFL